MLFKTIYVQAGQSLVDIAIQEYGNVEGIFKLLVHNKGLLSGITDELLAGDMLLVESSPAKPAENTKPLSKTDTALNTQLFANMVMNNMLNRNPAALGLNLVANDHEPSSSYDTPKPEGANYFRGDDYIYHHVEGRWKRSTILLF